MGDYSHGYCKKVPRNLKLVSVLFFFFGLDISSYLSHMTARSFKDNCNRVNSTFDSRSRAHHLNINRSNSLGLGDILPACTDMHHLDLSLLALEN